LGIHSWATKKSKSASTWQHNPHISPSDSVHHLIVKCQLQVWPIPFHFHSLLQIENPRIHKVANDILFCKCIIEKVNIRRYLFGWCGWLKMKQLNSCEILFSIQEWTFCYSKCQGEILLDKMPSSFFWVFIQTVEGLWLECFMIGLGLRSSIAQLWLALRNL
jgi:hypothetical protein